MRAASRLRTGGAKGFVLRAPEGPVRHLLWVDQYDGFYLSELDSKIEPSDANAAVSCDCRTPHAQRGRGYYAKAICLAAADLQRQQGRAWIFCASTSQSSLRVIRKAGFVHRFSLLRSGWFRHFRLTRQDALQR